MDLDDVVEAQWRIGRRVRRTPLVELEPSDDGLPGSRFLKLEHLQHTGTFKARGAFNRILTTQESGELDPEAGIVVASGGNAGLANAYAAAQLGVPATVYVPETAPLTKVEGLRRLGATVVLSGQEYAHAYDAAMDHVSRTPAVYCHAYDQPEIVAGAGTLGLELLDQLEQLGAHVDTVLVAVGGGGLIGGLATALSPSGVKVVGVEPITAPALHAALAAGEPVDVQVAGVAADSLGARRLGSIAWEVAVRTGIESVLVDDDAIVAARRMLWERFRLGVEHAAAAAVAALTTHAYQPQPDESLALIICGANTDPSTLVP